jgi:hypothetical protein
LKGGVEDAEACPFRIKTPSRAFESSATKSLGPAFTFKRVYIAVSLALIILIPTILVFNWDTSVRSIQVGEVLSVEYRSDSDPHTSISYAAKPRKDELGVLPKAETNTLDLNGDLRGIFKVGSYYNVTYTKRVLAQYADLSNAHELYPETRLIMVNYVGQGIGYGSDGRWFFTAHVSQLWNINLVFKGEYLYLFEIGGYYNITYVGDTIIGYQKLDNPYVFWVLTCLLTNYESTIDLVRLVPGNDTIVEIDVDGVACSEFTPVSSSQDSWVEFTFKVHQHLESDWLYTVTLRMRSGDVRHFNARAERGSGDLFT